MPQGAVRSSSFADGVGLDAAPYRPGRPRTRHPRQTAVIAACPVWSILIIALDVVIIDALAVQGREARAYP
jgi:hypothetical protein